MLTREPALHGRALARALDFPENFDDYADALESIGDIYEMRAGAPRLVLDSGYGWGLSQAVWLARWPGCTVYCISPDPPGMYGAPGVGGATDRLAPSERDRFCYHEGFLEEARRIFPRRRFDLVVVDTEHAYPAQLAQVIAAWAVLRPGGLLVGHDYDRPEVVRGTEEALAQLGQPFPQVLHTGDGTDFFYLWKGAEKV